MLEVSRECLTIAPNEQIDQTRPRAEAERASRSRQEPAAQFTCGTPKTRVGGTGVEKLEHALLLLIVCFCRLAAEHRAAGPSRERRASEVEMGDVVVSCPTLRGLRGAGGAVGNRRRTKHPPVPDINAQRHTPPNALFSSRLAQPLRRVFSPTPTPPSERGNEASYTSCSSPRHHANWAMWCRKMESTDRNYTCGSKGSRSLHSIFGKHQFSKSF